MTLLNICQYQSQNISASASTPASTSTLAPTSLSNDGSTVSVSAYNPWIQCSEFSSPELIDCAPPNETEKRKYCAFFSRDTGCNSEKECSEDVDSACIACTSGQEYSFVHEKYSCDEYFASLEEINNNVISEPFPEPLPLPEPIINQLYMRELCTESLRSANCSSENKKVCGFKSGCNPDYEVCFKQFNNKCDACGDSGIMEFANTECPGEDNCPNKPSEFCTMEWRGVCAHKKNCDSTNSNESCFETHGTVCQSCGEGANYHTIYDKPCYDLKPLHETCDGFREDSCVDDYDYGFEIFDLPAIEEPIYELEKYEDEVRGAVSGSNEAVSSISNNTLTEVRNAAIGTLEEVVNTIGSSESNGSNSSVGSASTEPSIGIPEPMYSIDPPAFFTPEVCGVKSNCTSDCERTYKNKCDACKNRDIGFIKRQGCSYAMSYMTTTNTAAPQLALDQDLATKNDGNSNQEFLQEAAPTAAGAVNGLSILPSFNAVICLDSERNAACPNTSAKVCGYKKCAGGNCPMEYNGRCNACKDSMVSFVVEDNCSNIGNTRVKIPCSSNERSDNCPINGINIKNKVCGEYSTTSGICTDDSCRKNFSNSCDACADNNVANYYEGDCSIKGIMFNYITMVLVLLWILN